MNDPAIQLTMMKIDKNKAVVRKKTEPPKEPTEWSKKSQGNFRDVDFLKTLEEKKKSQWVESSDKVIYSRAFSENDWRNRFSSPREVREIKSPGSNSGQSILKPS